LSADESHLILSRTFENHDDNQIFSKEKNRGDHWTTINNND